MIKNTSFGLFLFYLFLIKTIHGQVTYISSILKLNTVDTLIPSTKNIMVQDAHFPVAFSPLVQHTGSKASVILFVDYDEHTAMPDSFYYAVEILVKWYGINASNVQTEKKTLYLHHTYYGQSLDRSELRLTNKYKTELTVLRVKDKSGTIVPFTSISPRIKLMLRIESNEKNVCLTNPSPNYNLSASFNSTNKIIYLNWQSYPCADFYELEWVYVDDYTSGNNPTATLAAAQIPFTFWENAMRVRVRPNTYALPAVFDRGYVLFRVRAVQKKSTTAQADSVLYYTDEEYAYYPWSCPDFYDAINRKPSATVGTFIANAPAGYNNDYVYINDAQRWEAGKNWAYEMVADEEGNAHHLISYYDGLFLKKQEVSVVNGDSVAVVKEWFYDVSGRESVSTLPSVEKSNPLLNYYFSLNKNMAGQKYSYADFMLTGNQVAGCGNAMLLPGKMSTLSGSAKYYSNMNPYVAVWNTQKDIGRTLPDANGYPFVLKRMTDEPEPRVRETGLAGDSLQTGGRHGTFYYYGTPVQEELDRLLGNNAGYASYYTKTLIKDPNGNWMSEIKDLSGKTILSSLERRGNHLLPLQDTLIYIHTNLIKRDSGEWNDGLVPDSLGDSYTKTLVTPGGAVKWGYYLKVPVYQDSCVPNECFDCAFDWSLQIKNSCGQSYVPAGATNSKTLGITAGTDTVNYACDTTVRIIRIDTVTQTWNEGEVYITRTLQMNTAAIQKYYEEYVKKNQCLKTYEDFLRDELNKIDSSLCNLGCNQCVDSLMPNPIGTGNLCAATCDSDYVPTNVCDNIYPTMLMDVSPGGQYATYTADSITGAILNTGDIYSVFSNASTVSYLPKMKLTSYSSVMPGPAFSFGPVNFAVDAPYRHPAFFDVSSGGWKYFYPDANSNRDTVFLSSSASASNAKLTDTTKKWFSNTSGLYYTFPEYLTVRAFIDEFKTTWAWALVVYHPEFPYWWECKRTVEPQTMGGIKTFAFDDTLRTHPEKLFSAFYACNLLSHDPFFNSAIANIPMGQRWMRPYDWTINYNTISFCPGGISARQRMQQQMNNYMNTGKSIFQIAHLFVHCGSPVPSSACSIASNDTAVAQMAAQLYSNLKREVLMEFLHKRAMRYKAYNGVIGSGHITNPSAFASTISPPTATLSNTGNNWWFSNPCGGSVAHPHSDPTQIGNALSYSILQLSKEKRWGRTDELIGADTSWYMGTTGADTSMAVNCRCPAAETLNQMLSGLAQNNLLTGGSINIDSCSSLAVAGLASLTGASSSTLAVYTHSLTNGGKTLLIGLGGTCNTGTPGVQIQLDIPPGAPPYLNWNYNHIISLQNLQYLYASAGIHYFQMSLWYNNPNDSLMKDTILGKTCLDISCPKTCSLNCLYTYFDSLVTTIANTSALTSSSITLASNFTITGCPQIKNLCPFQYICNEVQRLTPCGSCTSCFFAYNIQSSNTANIHICCNSIHYSFILSASKPFSSLHSILITHSQIVPCASSCCSTIRYYYTRAGSTDSVDISFINHCSSNHPICLNTCTTSFTPDTSFLACSDLPPLYTPTNDSLDNPCLAAQLSNAANNATTLYNQYIDSVKKAFIADYIARCKKVKEYFYLQFPKEGNYEVLYLYDAVGNLLQTVPPEGVQPITNPAQLTQIKNYRNTGSGSPVFPSHLKASHYRYNSANLQTQQQTPDGGITNTYYDLALRPAASQSERQQDSSVFSYIKYDYKGRITESGIGKKSGSAPLTPSLLSAPNHPANWLSARREIVRTVYDKKCPALPTGWLQRNLRARISYQQRDDDGNLQPEHIFAYDYDPLGNVRSLYTYVEDLKGFKLGNTTSDGWKRMLYTYDLISGKVQSIHYQPNQPDQWIHRYRYDAMNRLISVRTSRDDWYYEEDARYSYYLHRPLARTELGQRRVQGTDFVYTINGWMKATNHWSTDSSKDAGNDALPASIHQYTAKDILAWQINYFKNDYKPIGFFNLNSFSNFVPLFNGNIPMTILSQDTLSTLARQFRYDALNRLRQATAYKENTGNFLSIQSFHEKFTYDKDGNIRQLSRWAAANVMDSLQYAYYAGNNRLRQVKEVVPANIYSNDIDNQADTLNYKYDKTGNLVEDVSENMRVHWTYYGKVKQIDSVKLTPPKVGLVWATKLKMKYDALGNRMVKENPIQKTKEIYVRDAQGNTIALYEIRKDSLYLSEVYMYGMQRLGYLEDRVYLGKKQGGKVVGGNIVLPSLPVIQIPNPFVLPGTTTVTPLYFGNKRYELNDWLGNVRVVINDRKTPVNTGTTTISYRPQVTSVNDYYAFGSQISERSYDPVKPLYRFGFNTQEKTFELNRDHYTAKYWEYDSRLGRRWNVDPKPDPSASPYVTYKANPTLYNDPLGDTVSISFRSGFLGLGKKQNVNYEAGYLFNKDGSEYTGKIKGFLSKALEALNTIRSSREGGIMLEELESSKNVFTIEKGTISKFEPSNRNKAFAKQFYTDPDAIFTYERLLIMGVDFTGGSGGTIKWNPSGTGLFEVGGKQGIRPAVDLAHEMFHGLDANRGLLDSRPYLEVARSEWQAVYRENMMRQQMGLPLRTHYRSQYNLNTGVYSPLPPFMLTPTGSPLQPTWYKH